MPPTAKCAVNYTATFPARRAVVRHGGAGTTAIGLRAGVPTLILWTVPDQPLWAALLKRLKVGSGRSFSTPTQKSLVVDLRRILAPQYVTRAGEIATRMTRMAGNPSTSRRFAMAFGPKALLGLGESRTYHPLWRGLC